MKKTITIVIPTYNEEANVLNTYDRLSRVFQRELPEYRMELLYIDNDSADDTRKLITSLATRDPDVKAIFNARNFGYSRSIFYGLTQAEADPDTLFAGRAASYERYQGEKLVKRNFDAYSYKYLCDALDSHNVGRGRGGVDSALASIKAHAIVVAVDTDLIFTPQESETWRNAIPDMEYHLIHSSFGHDGFLLENEQLIKIIEPVLCKY